MDLTKEELRKTLQGKRIATEIAGSGEDYKKGKYNSCMDMIYDHIRDSKENMISELPLDMSQGSKCGLVHDPFVEQKTRSLDWSLRGLREKLRNEETALLFLRKLQRSQLSLAVRDGLSVADSGSRQNHVVSNNVTVTTQSNMSHQMLARQQYTNHVMRRNLPTASTQHVVARQQEMNGQVPAHSQRLVNGAVTVKESNGRPQPSRPPAATHQSREPTLAQHQALAKLAIRRQLEATLLQLKMPKFTPQEMSIIPTVGFYADFTALVGMEEAIACIQDEAVTIECDVESEKLQPLQCVRCQTDFTPLWKTEEKGSKSVICEQCEIKSRKQAFKDEHTARLKAAFYQALQQERQIEIA